MSRLSVFLVVAAAQLISSGASVIAVDGWHFSHALHNPSTSSSADVRPAMNDHHRNLLTQVDHPLCNLLSASAKCRSLDSTACSNDADCQFTPSREWCFDDGDGAANCVNHQTTADCQAAQGCSVASSPEMCKTNAEIGEAGNSAFMAVGTTFTGLEEDCNGQFPDGCDVSCRNSAPFERCTPSQVTVDQAWPDDPISRALASGQAYCTGFIQESTCPTDYGCMFIPGRGCSDAQMVQVIEACGMTSPSPGAAAPESPTTESGTCDCAAEMRSYGFEV